MFPILPRLYQKEEGRRKKEGRKKERKEERRRKKRSAAGHCANLAIVNLKVCPSIFQRYCSGHR
jgi:hypothetical protein